MATDQIDSRISKGTKVSGQLNFDGAAKIEGEVEGEITGTELIIDAGALVKAKINVGKLTVAGTVLEGSEVMARERVELLATARVNCAISTPKLALNEGAFFEGDCRMPQRMAA